MRKIIVAAVVAGVTLRIGDGGRQHMGVLGLAPLLFGGHGRMARRAAGESAIRRASEIGWALMWQEVQLRAKASTVGLPN